MTSWRFSSGILNRSKIGFILPSVIGVDLDWSEGASRCDSTVRPPRLSKNNVSVRSAICFILVKSRSGWRTHSFSSPDCRTQRRIHSVSDAALVLLPLPSERHREPHSHVNDRVTHRGGQAYLSLATCKPQSGEVVVCFGPTSRVCELGCFISLCPATEACSSLYVLRS
jgi:hypothetical protein